VITQLHVPEFWMPFITGCIFYTPLLLGAFMLSSIPAPTEADKENRTERISMGRKERRMFFYRFWPGLVMLIVVYIALTIIRDFRDGFILEIWKEIGYTGSSVLTVAEMPIAFGVLLLVGLTMYIRKNNKAFWMIHAMV